MPTGFPDTFARFGAKRLIGCGLVVRFINPLTYFWWLAQAAIEVAGAILASTRLRSERVNFHDRLCHRCVGADLEQIRKLLALEFHFPGRRQRSERGRNL